MSTQYSTIYDAAVSRFSDYDLVALDEFEREEVLLRYMKSACSDFRRACKFNLDDRDEQAGSVQHRRKNRSADIRKKRYQKHQQPVLCKRRRKPCAGFEHQNLVAEIV